MKTDERLEDIVTFVLQLAAQPLSRTALMKLLYFIDLRSYERSGQGITGLDWMWHRFGPFSKSVYDVLDWMESHREVQIDVVRTYYGSPEYRIELDDLWGYYRPIEQREATIIRHTVQEFSHFGAQRLAELSYYTLPMQQVKERGDRLDFTAYCDSKDAPPAYVLDPRVPAPAKMRSR